MADGLDEALEALGVDKSGLQDGVYDVLAESWQRRHQAVRPQTPDEWMRTRRAVDGPSRVGGIPRREQPAPPAPAPPSTTPQTDLEQTEIPGGGGPLDVGSDVLATPDSTVMDDFMRRHDGY